MSSSFSSLASLDVALLAALVLWLWLYWLMGTPSPLRWDESSAASEFCELLDGRRWRWRWDKTWMSTGAKASGISRSELERIDATLDASDAAALEPARSRWLAERRRSRPSLVAKGWN